MNPFRTRQLAQTFGLHHAAAEDIVRYAVRQERRKLLPLTILVFVLVTAAMVAAFLGDNPRTYSVQLPLLMALVVNLVHYVLVCHRAASLILTAAQRTQVQKS